MSHELRVSPRAARDIREARRWLNEQREGVGDHFAAGVERCLDLIRQFPEMHPIAFAGYRKALVPHSHYAIYYEIVGDRVVVQVVWHGSRDPDARRRRLS